MMSIGRSSGRENLLWVTGIEPMKMIRTHLANHIRASSREQWLHQQARHMTAPDRNRRHAKKCLTARRRPHMTHFDRRLLVDRQKWSESCAGLGWEPGSRLEVAW